MPIPESPVPDMHQPVGMLKDQHSSIPQRLSVLRTERPLFMGCKGDKCELQGASGATIITRHNKDFTKYPRTTFRKANGDWLLHSYTSLSGGGITLTGYTGWERMTVCRVQIESPEYLWSNKITFTDAFTDTKKEIVVRGNWYDEPKLLIGNRVIAVIHRGDQFGFPYKSRKIIIDNVEEQASTTVLIEITAAPSIDIAFVYVLASLLDEMFESQQYHQYESENS